MHEVRTSVHVAANADTVWRALCATPRAPIVAALILRERLRTVSRPTLGETVESGRSVCEFAEGTVEETVTCEPRCALALHIVGGTLPPLNALVDVCDGFAIAPNCGGLVITRTTQFSAGRELLRHVSLPKIKRAIRKLQLQFLSEVKLHSERQ